MRVLLYLTAAITLLFAAIVHAEMKADFVSDSGKVHKAEGVTCEDCHLNGVDKIAPDKACYECHGTYADLAKLTETIKPNPHDSHIGQLRCTLCHTTHKPSKVYCNECHTFSTLKLK